MGHGIRFTEALRPGTTILHGSQVDSSVEVRSGAPSGVYPTEADDWKHLMERAKAIAIAAAVAMSLTSGAIALGANLGALGFAGAPNASPAPHVSVIAATPQVVPKAAYRLQHPEYDANELRADGAANPKD